MREVRPLPWVSALVLEVLRFSWISRVSSAFEVIGVEVLDRRRRLHRRLTGYRLLEGARRCWSRIPSSS